MTGFILGAIIVVLGVAIIVSSCYVTWRMAKGYSKLQASRTEVKHSHVWSPWDDHEVALYDGATLVRYAPGQLRTCLDPSCNAEDVRLVGGQTTSGDKDLD